MSGLNNLFEGENDFWVDIEFVDANGNIVGNCPASNLIRRGIPIEQITSAYNLQICRNARKSEYPPIQDYIDGVVKGDQSQIQAYIDACLSVKEKYPKPV